MQSLRAHFRLARAKDGDHDLCQAVCHDGRPVCSALRRKINADVSQLILPPPVRAVAPVVQDFYPGAL